VPCIVAPGRAVHALAALNEFSEKKRAQAQRQCSEHPRPIPPQSLALPAGPATLGEHRSKQLLKVYGVATVGEVLLSPAEIEALTRCPLAFPVAVKVESPDVPHKTEAGAVRLHLEDLASVKQAAIEVGAAARRHHSSAHIDGVLVQEMAQGLEVIVGAVNDPHFGPVVAFGPGCSAEPWAGSPTALRRSSTMRAR
jgi:acyl-CoA synthetase (NDP forming)